MRKELVKAKYSRIVSEIKPGKVFFPILLLLILQASNIFANTSIVRLKYRGGGDWYNDRSIIPNLAIEINRRTAVEINTKEVVFSFSDEDIFRYPFVFMTGHGNILFTEDEIGRIREYLMNGGFIYADDDYGMDESFRREIKRVFPREDLVEIPFDHAIYHSFYNLIELPKIHKHYGGPPKGLGIFHKGRMVVFYTYDTNISDGWADPEVHNDPPEKREEAFKMGVNIVLFALTH